MHNIDFIGKMSTTSPVMVRLTSSLIQEYTNNVCCFLCQPKQKQTEQLRLGIHSTKVVYSHLSLFIIYSVLPSSLEQHFNLELRELVCQTKALNPQYKEDITRQHEDSFYRSKTNEQFFVVTW